MIAAYGVTWGEWGISLDCKLKRPILQAKIIRQYRSGTACTSLGLYAVSTHGAPTDRLISASLLAPGEREKYYLGEVPVSNIQPHQPRRELNDESRADSR